MRSNRAARRHGGAVNIGEETDRAEHQARGLDAPWWAKNRRRRHWAKGAQPRSYTGLPAAAERARSACSAMHPKCRRRRRGLRTDCPRNCGGLLGALALQRNCEGRRGRAEGGWHGATAGLAHATSDSARSLAQLRSPINYKAARKGGAGQARLRHCYADAGAAAHGGFGKAVTASCAGCGGGAGERKSRGDRDGSPLGGGSKGVFGGTAQCTTGVDGGAIGDHRGESADDECISGVGGGGGG